MFSLLLSNLCFGAAMVFSFFAGSVMAHHPDYVGLILWSFMMAIIFLLAGTGMYKRYLCQRLLKRMDDVRREYE